MVITSLKCNFWPTDFKDLHRLHDSRQDHSSVLEILINMSFVCYFHNSRQDHSSVLEILIKMSFVCYFHNSRQDHSSILEILIKMSFVCYFHYKSITGHF